MSWRNGKGASVFANAFHLHQRGAATASSQQSGIHSDLALERKSNNATTGMLLDLLRHSPAQWRVAHKKLLHTGCRQAGSLKPGCRPPAKGAVGITLAQREEPINQFDHGSASVNVIHLETACAQQADLNLSVLLLFFEQGSGRRRGLMARRELDSQKTTVESLAQMRPQRKIPTPRPS